MRALITGGAGFIGSHLADALLERGDDVAVIDDLSTGRMENIQHLKPKPRFSYTIDTIKPAPYPNRNIPAHVHVHLRGPGFDQEEEIRFEGSGRTICNLHRDSDGILRCTVNFQLRGKR